MRAGLPIIIFIVLFCQRSTSQAIVVKPSFSIVADTSIGKQLLQQCSRSAPDNVDSFWIPTEMDVKHLEKNLNRISHLKAADCCFNGSKIDNLKNFCFQYLGVIIGGRRYIYVNAFSSETLQWYKDKNMDLSRNAIVVCDGGTSFWGVLYDLRDEKFLSLSFNGVA